MTVDDRRLEELPRCAERYEDGEDEPERVYTCEGCGAEHGAPVMDPTDPLGRVELASVPAGRGKCTLLCYACREAARRRRRCSPGPGPNHEDLP